jgi:oligopeptide transport system substrate-binding protein
MTKRFLGKGLKCPVRISTRGFKPLASHHLWNLGIFILMLGLTLPQMTWAQDAVEVTIALPNPISLDPVSLSRFDTAGRDIAENLFVGLTRLNARTGQVEPQLAESWEVSADGLLWTFKLRNDIQWVGIHPETNELSALRPVVASDVVFAIQRACDPLRPSPRTSNIFIIKGCRVMATQDSLEPLPLETVAIQAIDDTTLQIELLFPASSFLTMTSLPEFRPLPPEFINDSVGNWPRPGAVVTSGAWIVDNWEPNAQMRLVRNPFWAGEFEGNVTAVNIRFNAPIDTLALEIDQGTYDLARLDPLLVQSGVITQTGWLKSNDGNTLTLLGYSYNNQDAEGLQAPTVLDIPDVRRALSLAIDRQTLVGSVYGSTARPTDRFTPRTVIAAPSTPGAGFDPVTAQNLLARAGFPACAGFGQLSIAVSNDPLDLQLAQNIVAQWGTNLGCPAETFPVVPVSRTAVLESAHNTVDVSENSRFPLWLITWSGDYPDAQAWVTDALHCDYGYFRAGQVCDNTDTLMDQANAVFDITSRFTFYNQIESGLFGTQGTFPVAPLAMELNWWAQKPSLSGVASYGALQFDRWTVEGSTG